MLRITLLLCLEAWQLLTGQLSYCEHTLQCLYVLEVAVLLSFTQMLYDGMFA